MTVVEDTATSLAVLANDTDADGDTLTIASLVAPSHGTAVINAGTSVTYTPAPNYSGADTFTYTVSDGNGGTATAAVTLTVTAVNDPPVATADTATSASGAVTIDVLANDTDVDGDTLAIGAVTQGAHGAVVVSGTSVIYTPVAGFTGTDNFTYTVNDGHGASATAAVDVSVVAVNRAPVAVDDTITVKMDKAKTINVLANDHDPDGDSLRVSTTTSPAHGSLTVNADNTITYTPTAGYVGGDTFTYTAQDPAGATAVATVTVNVVENRRDDFDKDACKKGGWLLRGFRNQGLCIATSNHINHEDDDDDGDDHCRGRHDHDLMYLLILQTDGQLSSANIRDLLDGRSATLTLDASDGQNSIALKGKIQALKKGGKRD